MASLDEFCWDQILKFLSPLDLIRISEVFPVAKAASVRSWKKIGISIRIHDDQRWKIYNHIDDELISIRDARKILLQVSPVATNLSLWFRDKSSTVYFIKFKHFEYKLTEGLNEALELLAANTAELKTIQLTDNIRLTAETIARLFSQNNIPKVSVNQLALNELCEKNLTGWVKNMDCIFRKTPHFPNLQALKIQVKCYMKSKEDLRDLLLSILPYTVNLKVFSLLMSGDPDFPTINMMTNGLENIFNLSQLEELQLQLRVKAELVEEFCDKLVTNLPRLQVVRIGEFKLSDRAVLMLMSLPEIKIVSLGYNIPNQPWRSSGILKSLERFSTMQRYRFDTQGPDFRDVISRCILDEVFAALSRGKRIVLNDSDNGRIAIVKSKSDRLIEGFSHENTFLVDLISSRNNFSILEVLLEETKAYLKIHQKDSHAFIFKEDRLNFPNMNRFKVLPPFLSPFFM